MSDSISREQAINRINKQREHLQPEVYPQDAIGDAAYRICAEIIERLPSAERVGKWEMKSDPYGFFDEIPVCSECGCTTKMRERYNYCPNCGARMVSENDSR